MTPFFLLSNFFISVIILLVANYASYVSPAKCAIIDSCINMRTFHVFTKYILCSHDNSVNLEVLSPSFNGSFSFLARIQLVGGDHFLLIRPNSSGVKKGVEHV